MRTTISREVEFDAGHRVPWHDSKCRNPHGHRYRVVIDVSGPVQHRIGESEHGMVLDFGRLKTLLVERVHDRYDHGFIVYEGDYELLACFTHGDAYWNVQVVSFVPTAENLAAAVFLDLEPEVKALAAGVQLDSVTVFETPTCKAVVTR